MAEVGLAAVLTTAAALAMDAFSVSICVGLAVPGARLKNGIRLGVVFGAFQFLMPLAGAVIAWRLAGFLGVWAIRASAALIFFVALKIFFETVKHSPSCKALEVNPLNLLLLGVATSLDALAVGFSIKSVGGSALLLAAAAGAATFALSLLGCLGGGRLGEKIGERAQYAGATVLIIIAANIAFSSY